MDSHVFSLTVQQCPELAKTRLGSVVAVDEAKQDLRKTMMAQKRAVGPPDPRTESIISMSFAVDTRQLYFLLIVWTEKTSRDIPMTQSQVEMVKMADCVQAPPHYFRFPTTRLHFS